MDQVESALSPRLRIYNVFRFDLIVEITGRFEAREISDTGPKKLKLDVCRLRLTLNSAHLQQSALIFQLVRSTRIENANISKPFIILYTLTNSMKNSKGCSL